MAKKETAKERPAPKPKRSAKPKLKAKTKSARPPRTVSSPVPAPVPTAAGETAAVLDRLWGVVISRRNADPTTSHSARLLSRGTDKVAQKFGEEAVECLIEAVAGNRAALIAESADVLYHLIVMWVNAGVRADQVWAELSRREGTSGLAEKAGRAQQLAIRSGTRKIP
jgi:phosphoribosyl-ATP pyrophosphohydrolase